MLTFREIVAPDIVKQNEKLGITKAWQCHNCFEHTCIGNLYYHKDRGWIFKPKADYQEIRLVDMRDILEFSR